MSEPERETSEEERAEASLRALGRRTLGRELTADESAALSSILKAAVQALKHGFVQRLARQVQSERETESVEEFFANIRPG